jgi:hypothetical protein
MSNRKTISRTRLRRIILEELERTLQREGTPPKKKHLPSHKRKKQLTTEINPAHNPKTGKFQSRDKPGVYSLTKNAEEEIGDSKDLKVQRGTTSGKGSVSSKFGMNTGSPDKQCGKLTIDGEKKKKTRRCRDYPKSYWKEELEPLIEQLLDEASNDDICSKCIQAFLNRLRRANAALKSAQDGKLDEGEGRTELVLSQAGEDTSPHPDDDDQEELEETTPLVHNPQKKPKTHYRGEPVTGKDRKTASRRDGEKRKKLKRQAGLYQPAFSQSEKQLLNPNSLFEWATKTGGKS